MNRQRGALWIKTLGFTFMRLKRRQTKGDKLACSISASLSREEWGENTVRSRLNGLCRWLDWEEEGNYLLIFSLAFSLPN